VVEHLLHVQSPEKERKGERERKGGREGGREDGRINS
jgi:hypothetical protein